MLNLCALGKSVEMLEGWQLMSPMQELFRKCSR